MNMKRFFFLIVLAALLVACTAAIPPGPRLIESPLGPSPLSPLPVPGTQVIPFKLDRPILVGATEVHGTGLAGVPIYIADITFMGEPLGTGKVGPDGKFVIIVKPLEAAHRIGVALGILEGTPWKPEDFYRQEFYGPDAMQVPQVAFFYDTVLVGQQ
jgi:hypothetical protein